MHLVQLWRYPVKSMGGERLASAELREDGLVGDRVVLAVDARGRLRTARTHGGLLGLRATLGPDGEPLVDGRSWRDPAVREAVRRVTAPDVRLIRYDEPERFDILPLLVTTDGALAAFAHDSRRLRPNLVIGGVDGLDERSWEGRRLRVGETEIQLADLRGRCNMINFDPDSQVHDPSVLRDVVRRFGGTFGLNAAVIRGGVLHEGDPVTLLDA